jgi:predicted metal-dependent hydrolase
MPSFKMPISAPRLLSEAERGLGVSIRHLLLSAVVKKRTTRKKHPEEATRISSTIHRKEMVMIRVV